MIDWDAAEYSQLLFALIVELLVVLSVYKEVSEINARHQSQ